MVKTYGREDKPRLRSAHLPGLQMGSSVLRWSSAPLAAGKVVWKTGDEAAAGTPGVRCVHEYLRRTKNALFGPRALGWERVELNSVRCIAHDGPNALSGTFTTYRPSGA